MATASHSAQGKALTDQNLMSPCSPPPLHTPPPPFLHSCYLMRTTELQRADQLLILFSPYPAVGMIMSECVCCERADTARRWEGPRRPKQQGGQNTLGLLRETHKMHFSSENLTRSEVLLATLKLDEHPSCDLQQLHL